MPHSCVSSHPPLEKGCPLGYNSPTLSSCACLSGFQSHFLAQKSQDGRVMRYRWSEALSECILHRASCHNSRWREMWAVKMRGCKAAHTKHLIQHKSCTAQIYSCPTLSPICQTTFTWVACHSLYKRLNTGGFLEKAIVPMAATCVAGRGPI